MPIDMVEQPANAVPGADSPYRRLFRDLPCSALATLERTTAPGSFIFIDANQRFADLFAMPPEQIAGKTLTDLLPNARRCGLMDLLNRVHRTGKPGRRPVLIFEGDRIVGWRDARVFRLAPSGPLVCSFPSVDILHHVIDSMFGYLGIFTTEGIFIDTNSAPLEFAGLAREDVIGRPFWEIPWWTHCTETQNRLRDALARAARGEVVGGEFTAKAGDGKTITIEGTFGPVRGDEGEISLVVGCGVDVTDRVRAVNDLRSSESLFRAFIDNTPNLIAQKTADGRFLLANKAQAELGRIRDTNVFGKTSEEIFSPDQAKRAVAHDRQVIETGEVVTEERFIDGPQGRRDFLITKFPIFDDDGAVAQIGVVGTDITVTKRAEEAIRHNEQRIRLLEQNLARLERVSSLGTMLSGLAHELNQPLAALQLYSNRLLAMGRNWPDPPAGVIDALGEMQRLTDLANRIILRIRGSVEPSFSEPKRINCLEAIAEVLELVRPDAAAAGIEIAFDPPAGEISLLANMIDLQLILSNLIRNSREALMAQDGDGGRCIRVDIDCDETRDMICISVADNGPGIDAASKNLVFTPFYTTKQTGMGLGLSMAQGLAEGMNGHLKIFDNTPSGAIVHLCLPRSVA